MGRMMLRDDLDPGHEGLPGPLTHLVHQNRTLPGGSRREAGDPGVLPAASVPI